MTVSAEATVNKSISRKKKTKLVDIDNILEADMPPVFDINKMPTFIKFITQASPMKFKSCVAEGSFAPLGCYMKGVYLKHITNEKHEPALMCLLMAPSSSGKSCWDEPISRIMSFIEADDKKNRDRLKEWSKECSRKGDNQKKPDRPENCPVQYLGTDLTHASFIRMTADADPYRLYYKGNEIEVLKSLQNSKGGDNWAVVICYNFDYGNRYGSERVGKDSVNEIITVRINMNLCTTIDYGRKFFSRVLTKGPVHRLNIITLPEQQIGEDFPKYGDYPKDFNLDLKTYIDRLKNAHGDADGYIECKEAKDFINVLKKETDNYCALTQDRVLWEFSHRALVIAHKKAWMLYILNDYKWSEEIEDYVRWSYYNDLYCKNKFFLSTIREKKKEDSQPTRKGPGNLLTGITSESVTKRLLVEHIKTEYMKNYSTVCDNDHADQIFRSYKSRKLIKLVAKVPDNDTPEAGFLNSKGKKLKGLDNVYRVNKTIIGC